MTMTPRHYPSVDDSFARLHRAGWSIGETGDEELKRFRAEATALLGLAKAADAQNKE
jgi:hypothetical protein